MDEHEHVHGLVGAYVLGAVTPQEAAWVKEHLATCAACRRAVEQLREVESLLPALAGAAAPPPALKARLMEIVEAEARAGAPRDGASASAGGGAKVGRDGGAGRPAWGRAGGLRAPLLALAACLALVLAGLTVWRLHDSTSSGPTVEYALQGTAAQPSIGGSLQYDEGANRLQLEVHGLRALPVGRVYELWLIRGNFAAVEGAGVFRPDAHGAGHLTLAGQQVRGYDAAGLTIEQGRSATPHAPIVAEGKLSS